MPYIYFTVKALIIILAPELSAHNKRDNYVEKHFPNADMVNYASNHCFPLVIVPLLHNCL